MPPDLVRLLEFDKDMKRLKKRFRTLEEDLDVFIRSALVPFHEEGTDYGGIVEISDIGIKHPSLYKVKRFACRALKGRGNQSGIRIIYAYFKGDNRIELVEVYFKGDKANEDRKRILSKYA